MGNQQRNLHRDRVWGRSTTLIFLSNKEFINMAIYTKCFICNKEFDALTNKRASQDVITCSRYCASVVRNMRQSRTNRVILMCDMCDKGFSKTHKKIKNNNFCSIECDHKYRKTVKAIGAKVNKDDQIKKKKYYGPMWRKTAQLSRDLHQNVCQDCGISEEELGQKLSVHHIVPFVSFDSIEEANLQSNLIPICEKCHRVRHSGENHPSKFKTIGLNGTSVGDTRSKNQEKALRIIEDLKNNEIKTYTEIANKNDCSLITVRRINQGIRWSELHQYKLPIR